MIRLSLVLALGGALAASRADRFDRRERVEQQVEALVAAGRHPNLRWPDFTDVQADLDRIYSGRDWQPLWFPDDTLSSAGRALIKVLGEADNRGLTPADYDVAWFQAEAGRPIPSGDSTLIARLDVGLSVAAARFALALRLGRINPVVVHAAFKLPMDSFTVDSTILHLAATPRPNEVLSALEPGLLHYYLLIGALLRYRRLAQDSGLVALPPMPRRLHPGESYVGLPTLRRLLRLLGDDR
ncbi:MAG TPA: hypothetical protein VG817_00405, partial [Gemmatimonadales bacterium]|nr:hypothetical protein [Gemmatimonadales bacterium]